MTLNPCRLPSDWSQLHSAPASEQLAAFHQALALARPEDVPGGFRAFAAELMTRGLISMAQYVSIFAGHALTCLAPAGPGVFLDMADDSDAADLAAIYSRAKYGSIGDIRQLAWQVIDYLEAQLDDPLSHWARLFSDARDHGDNVVMMTTGWRNVPSTANVLYDIVVEEINVTLAHKGLPTIINVKLPRIAPPCENYASLSTEERERVNLVQDHVIPAENFYRWSGVHVIFGDDVLVTGSTADKVFHHSMRAGAKSFQAIYPVAVDPRVALSDATIEERLNMTQIGRGLGDNLARLLSDPQYQPILRTLRLVFGADNHAALEAFLPRVPAGNWLRLYRSALGNEFLRQDGCVPSLARVRRHLVEAGLLRADGRTVRP